MPRNRAEELTPLLIDRAAAAEIPLEEAIREFGPGKRSSSSAMTDTAQERGTAALGIRSVGASAVLFEEFGGRDADPENAYLGEIETADIYLGILGRKYGKPLSHTVFSATHSEYRHAVTCGSSDCGLVFGGRRPGRP